MMNVRSAFSATQYLFDELAKSRWFRAIAVRKPNEN
jgi:hypothetical protein